MAAVSGKLWLEFSGGSLNLKFVPELHRAAHLIRPAIINRAAHRAPAGLLLTPLRAAVNKTRVHKNAHRGRDRHADAGIEIRIGRCHHHALTELLHPGVAQIKRLGRIGNRTRVERLFAPHQSCITFGIVFVAGNGNRLRLAGGQRHGCHQAGDGEDLTGEWLCPGNIFAVGII